MMKIWSISWKDALLRFSDRTELLFFLILPVVFIFMLSGGISRQSEQGIPVLVVDKDHSQMASDLVAALSSSGTVEPRIVSQDEAEEQFAGQNAPAWLTIPAGFESRLLAGEAVGLDFRRAPNNTSADAAERAVWTAAGSINRQLAVAHTSLAEAERMQAFASPAERQAFFAQSLAAAKQAFQKSSERVKVIQTSASAQANQNDQASLASTGQIITWVFIPLLGISGLFAYERNRKTLQRLLTTPTQKATFLLGTITGQVILAIVQMAILIGFSALALKVAWGRSPTGVAMMVVAFSLASVSLGTMLGTFVKTEKQASNLSIMLGMIMALLGGCWWPIEMFPQAMRTAAIVLPTTWAMQGFTGLVIRGLEAAQVLPSVGALLGFAVIFFAIAVLRFRYE